jgi:Predicted pyrophosphatase
MDIKTITDLIDEVSVGYAEKFGIERDATWFLLKLQEEVGELTQCYLTMTGQARTRGLTEEQIRSNFGAEIADVFCHVLLLARHHGIDVESEVGAKWLTRRGQP